MTARTTTTIDCLNYYTFKAPRATDNLYVGKTLNTYLIESALASGAFGKSFAVRDLSQKYLKQPNFLIFNQLIKPSLYNFKEMIK